MKNSLVAKIFVFLFVLFLVKAESPSVGATKNVYFTGIQGALTSTDISQAYKFNTIKEAYTKQIELGEGWNIVTE